MRHLSRGAILYICINETFVVRGELVDLGQMRDMESGIGIVQHSIR